MDGRVQGGACSIVLDIIGWKIVSHLSGFLIDIHAGFYMEGMGVAFQVDVGDSLTGSVYASLSTYANTAPTVQPRSPWGRPLPPPPPQRGRGPLFIFNKNNNLIKDKRLIQRERICRCFGLSVFQGRDLQKRTPPPRVRKVPPPPPKKKRGRPRFSKSRLRACSSYLIRYVFPCVMMNPSEWPWLHWARAGWGPGWVLPGPHPARYGYRGLAKGRPG